ncbi:MAG: flagellar filament capping protein FliD [Alphaproteobacteria bacterium]|nr:flagellar filament capping protein FliD [Alphaproteobacteria bacterium]
MVSSVNLNNINVDENGQVSFSGVGSGIDFAEAVDNIIAARRIPVDRLEADVEANGEKITAFNDLRGLLNTLRGTLDDLRGRVTFQNAGDVFESKEVFASTLSLSGTPSAAANLIGASVTNAADAGSHTIEILQTATAHKFSSNTATSITEDLGVAFGASSGSISGAFEINGSRIMVEPSDTLVDLRDRINAANAGSSATGVTASVVSVSASENILVLTADATGQSIQIAKSHRIGSSAATDTSSDLGTAFGAGANAIAGAFEINGVQIDVDRADTLDTLVTKINAANTGATASILSVGGTHTLALTTDDATQNVALDLNHRIGSGSATSTTADLGTAFGHAANSVVGSFDVNGQTVSIVGTDTLETLRDKINNAGAGVTAKIITNGASDFTLAVTSDDATQAIAVTAEVGNVLTSASGIGLSNDGGTTFLNELSVSQDVLADLGLSADGGTTPTNVLSDTNDVLVDLGISNDGGTTFVNELVTAQNARFRADGLIDTSASQSVGVATATTAYNTTGTLSITLPDLTTVDITVDAADTPTTLAADITGSASLAAAGITGTVIQDDDGNFRLEIRQSDLTTTDPGKVLDVRSNDPAVDTVGIDNTLTFDFTNGQIAQINVTSGQTLNQVRDNINADVDLTAAGVSAQVVADGSQFKLVIQHDATVTATGPAGLGLATPELIIERDSNTVSDLFTGMTLNLFQAEVGTTIQLDVERNLGGVKEGILDFVDAYNAVKSFINEQNLADPATGEAAEGAGALFADPTLAGIEQGLSRFLGLGAQGLDDGFRVLEEIGVNFVDNDNLTDPLLADTLEVDETELDEALLNNADDVRELFAFEFSASDPRVSLIDFDGQTQVASGGYSLDVTVSNGVITGATIDGVANSATVSGNIITATDATGAAGLKIIYTGNVSASNINLDFSTGVASSLFFEIDRVLDETTGDLELEVDNLNQLNDLAETRIDEMLERLEFQREQLLERFVAMEAALVTMNNTLETIRQQIDALTADNG